MGTLNTKIVSNSKENSISDECDNEINKSIDNLRENEICGCSPGKQISDNSNLSLKKRSQSFDTGKMLNRQKIFGNKVEKFRRKHRKKSIDSIDSEPHFKYTFTQNGNENMQELPQIGDPPKPLTECQKKIIKECWSVIQDQVSKVGVIVFTGLFETHPDVQEVFLPFRGLASIELRASNKLRAHGLRVMSFVEKGVSRLEKPGSMQTLLEECGRNHQKYGVRPDLIDLIGPQFIMAIQPSIGSKWTNEMASAWQQFFLTLTYEIKKTMLSNESENSK